MRKTLSLILAVLLCLSLLACQTDPPGLTETTDAATTAPAPTTTQAPQTTPPVTEPPTTTPADPLALLRTAMPRTDGSTSTLPLDIAVHAAILGISTDEAAARLSHTKTYTSLQNLVAGKCDLILRTPMSAGEADELTKSGFAYTAEPISSEGFVFVVNRDNPVDSLTEAQLRDIYAGKITNWREVGGADLPIIPYQRNADSGSQNYMLTFMGDVPLMAPITEPLPATMSGILDAIANYDNAAGAIGYSVYAYSDGMYEGMAKIKYIKVNGVEPGLATIADGSYPLIGYNYAIFDATLPADAPARLMTAWMQSDEGQRTVAAAGYVPYRPVEGLVLPGAPKYYTATGTGTPASDADCFYLVQNRIDTVPTLANPTVEATVRAYLDAERARLAAIPEREIEAFAATRAEPIYTAPEIKLSIKNGYLSVLSGIRYLFGFQASPTHYYQPVGAVFDLYTGRRLTLSDLFPVGRDFVPTLNAYLADRANQPYSGFGMTHTMIRDFRGLIEGEFTFTADEIIFYPGNTFAEGVTIPLDGLFATMSTAAPRDMQGIFAGEEKCIYRVIPSATMNALGGVETYPNGNTRQEVTLWLLDPDRSGLSPAVCDTINAFVRDYYATHLTPEHLRARLRTAGIDPAQLTEYYVGPWADFTFTLYGRRYLKLSGANLIQAGTADGQNHAIPVTDLPTASSYYAAFFFDATTGAPLRLETLFKPGWQDEHIPADYTILDIADYDRAPNHTGKPADNDIPVTVTILADGAVRTVTVPRIFVR